MATTSHPSLDLQELRRIVGAENVLEHEPLSRHCTFRIGGAARLFVRPRSTEELASVLRALKEADVRFLVVGKGSNLLFSDDGFDGAVVEIGRLMARCTIEGTIVRAQAGISLSSLAKQAAKAGLAGLEFASGIPGTLGGALYMNAGAYGGQMSDVVQSARILDESGAVHSIEVAGGDFGYRKSPVQSGGVVVDAVLELRQDDPDAIARRMRDLDERRRSKQPLELPSAGSTFKRPEGHYASALVDQAGLKGYRHGGAAVSEKHAGFVVNLGDATAADVQAVIEHVQDVVLDRFDVRLEPEVRIIRASER